MEKRYAVMIVQTLYNRLKSVVNTNEINKKASSAKIGLESLICLDGLPVYVLQNHLKNIN